MSKKVFNVYVMVLQAKPYKDRMHYTIKKWHGYYHVSHKLACYLMYCNGCAHITGWNNGKPLLSLNNDHLHGCCIDEVRARKMTFCIAQRVRKYKQDTECGMIYPQIPVIGCDVSQFFDTAIAKTLEFVIKNESKVEHSFCCYRWGAIELVPKEFYIINTSGIEIEKGDYYWDSDISRHRDCWVSVDNTYSAHKPGEKIGSVKRFGRMFTEPIIIRKYKR